MYGSIQEEAANITIGWSWQVLRLEGRLLEMEAQASAAEDARAAADAELEQIRQTLEEDRAAAERHVQVCISPNDQ